MLFPRVIAKLSLMCGFVHVLPGYLKKLLTDLNQICRIVTCGQRPIDQILGPIQIYLQDQFFHFSSVER